MFGCFCTNNKKRKLDLLLCTAIAITRLKLVVIVINYRVINTYLCIHPVIGNNKINNRNDKCVAHLLVFTNSQFRIPKFLVSFLLICCLSYLIEKIRKKSEFRIHETIWGTAKIVEINSLKKTSTFWMALVSITYV